MKITRNLKSRHAEMLAAQNAVLDLFPPPPVDGTPDPFAEIFAAFEASRFDFTDDIAHIEELHDENIERVESDLNLDISILEDAIEDAIESANRTPTLAANLAHELEGRMLTDSPVDVLAWIHEALTVAGSGGGSPDLDSDPGTLARLIPLLTA